KAFMQTYGDSTVGRAYSQVDPQQATMNVVGADGLNTARITADGNSVTLFSATNGQRYLKLDDTGIWIETGGKSYNLEETAQDSGWINIAFNSGFQRNGSNSPFQYRRVGNMCYLRGRIQRTRGTFALNTSYNIGSIPSADGPSYLQRTIVGSGPSTSW